MKRGMTLVLIGVFMFQLVSAIDTQINVKTMPYHRVDIRTLNPSDNSMVESFHKTSNLSGDVSITSAASLDSFNVAVWVREENIVVAYKIFESNLAGSSVNLELYPEGYVPPAPVEEVVVDLNQTANETVSEENQTPAEQNGAIVTGSVSQGIFSNKLFLYGGGALLLLIIIGVVVYVLLKKRKERYYKYGFKKNDWNSYQKDKKEDFYKSNKSQKEDFEEEYSEQGELEEAEKKIREAQETIRRIKNEGKMTEIKQKLLDDKRKMIQDQQELMKLRGGNPNQQNNSNAGNFNKKHPNSFRREDRSNRF